MRVVLGAPRALNRGGLLVGDEVAVDDIGDAAFQRPHRFLFGFAFGQFAVVVGAASAGVAELGDGGHVDGVVECAVAAPV